MSKYEGRFKALEHKLPRPVAGPFKVHIGSEDGTNTTEDGRRLGAHEYKRDREAQGHTVLLIGYDRTEEEKREDEERTRRWHENRRKWGLE